MASETTFGGSNAGSNTKTGQEVGGMKDVKEKMHHAVDSAADRASELASRAKERAVDYAHNARGSIDQWVRDLGSMMERRPIATIAIGVAFGYFLAKMRNRH
jgi:hypothetical protein